MLPALLLLVLPVGVIADGIAAVSQVAPGRFEASSATFFVTLARVGESAAAVEALIDEFIAVQGAIRPEAAHVGQDADVFVVHYSADTGFRMLTGGRFAPWNGHIADLLPARRGITLADRTEFPIFAGRVGIAGTQRLYLGYRPADGQLRYTPLPHLIDIVNLNPLDAALALYTRTIAPDILPLCLRCHYAGGRAPTAAHKFTPLDNSAHMELNIAEFRMLLRPPRGKDYVLGKVQGGGTHGGNVVVPANSNEFLALERFLNLLQAAQD